MDTEQFFQDLLRKPADSACGSLKLADGIEVTARVEASGLFLLLTAPFGASRRRDDFQLFSHFLAWNGEHLDVAAPYITLDEDGDMFCVCASLPLCNLAAETATEAALHISRVVSGLRAQLVDSVSFVN